MKQIQLTRGKVALVDDGDFDFLNQWKWQVTKGKRKRTYYATRFLNDTKQLIFMHRIILGLTDAKIFTDHRDHDGLNNQKNNLRPCTQSQNEANKIRHTKTSSKYFGVCWDKTHSKWYARITKNRVNTYLGLFDSEIDAALAYNHAAKRIHGEFASLNELY